MDSSWTDSWGDARPIDLALYLGLPSNPNTPSRDTPTRASRARGNVNLTHYDSFTRVTKKPKKELLFRVGDAVIVSKDAPLPQLWLREGFKLKPTGKGNRAAANEGVPVDDGLPYGARVAIIAGLHQDEKEHMKATLRWLARPRMTLENPGSPEEADLFEKVQGC
jgi:hypothetical protein